jgi:hypothetical protein
MPDMSLSGFIEHLARFDIRLHEQTHKGLEHAASIVEAEAWREFGHYQDAAGPFAAWAELADATKDDRTKHGYTENDPGLRSGEMQASLGHEVAVAEAVVGSNDQNLVYFELGTERQPPRSILGIAMVHKTEDVVHVLGGSVVSALIGRDVFKGRIPISGS